MPTNKTHSNYVKQPITLQELAQRKFGGSRVRKFRATNIVNKADKYPIGSNAQQVLNRCFKPVCAAVNS